MYETNPQEGGYLRMLGLPSKYPAQHPRAGA
jgi:hypothetical protein